MSLKIPIIYEVKGRKKRLFVKVDTIADAWEALHKTIKKKWHKKFGLERYQLYFEAIEDDDTYEDEINTLTDLINAYENRGQKLKITVEEKEEDSDSADDTSEQQKQVEKEKEQKQAEEEKKQIEEKKDYEIKNPLVICIGISKYEKLDSELTTGCEINTETMLKLFINKYKYDLQLAIHNQNQDMISLKKDNILGKLAEARDTILKSVGSKSQIDGLIIALSGHGRGNDIYCSDYDTTERSKKINIGDIQTVFHGAKDDEYKFPDIPKIVIIDAFPPEDDEEQKEDSMDNNMIKNQNWYCFCASSIGYAGDGDYDVDTANQEGGYLIKAIKDIMEDPLCYENTQDQWALQKIKGKIQIEAWKLTGNVKGMRLKMAIFQQTENIKRGVKFQMGSCINEYKKKKFITNPVIVNIGVSLYNNKNNLDECANDITTMNKLWRKYGYGTIIDNEKQKKLTKKKFDKIMKRAQNEFRKESHDAFIISFSGHGDADSIWLSDYDNKKGNVRISEMTAWVSHPAVSDKDDCPRIAIIDACRGSEEVGIDRSKGDGNIHPMKNWVILYSNSNGYKSENADDGSGGMLITSVFEKLSDIDKACRKKWGNLQDDIGALVDKKSGSKQCCTPTGGFFDYDVYLMPKGRGKGDGTAILGSGNTQSSETTK